MMFPLCQFLRKERHRPEIGSFWIADCDLAHGRFGDKEIGAHMPTAPSGAKIERRVKASRFRKEMSMRKTILTAVALVLFSSTAMAQSTDTKSPATTGPADQSDRMSKGDMSKDKMSKKKNAKSKSTKTEKTEDKM
jgi:hypothetical protein